MVEQDIVCCVIPVSNNDGEFFVVMVYFLWRVNDQRCTETVHVLPLFIRLASIQNERNIPVELTDE